MGKITKTEKYLLLLTAIFLLCLALLYFTDHRSAGGGDYTVTPQYTAQEPEAPDPPAVPGKVNINTADAAQLEALDGIGPTLAQRIVAADVPEDLLDKRVLSLDLSGMVACTKYRGEFEERLRKILKEIKKLGDVVLFLDELHTLVGAGSAEGAIDAANILKPALGRGEIQIIGATTLN